MKRSRLKNIINKSKTISNKQEVGNPFDEFKKSLPIEIDDNYRLEAAWKAYGSPKDYKAALWEGLIQPIDENNYKLPSIGYNEETDEYEYLNKGEDNETVAKDIRVWDNDVIPLVQELKLGGYVRTFNKEKDCWTYTKNSQKENTLDQEQINIQKEPSGDLIDSFQKGGKPEYKKVKSDKAYYDKDSDTVYYTNDEDLIHEGFHARPDSVLLEQLKPYYENLNDEKIQNFGGNLQFVKRFEGDPGHFYSPEELGARISAAKFKTKGNNYSPEFFKYLRTNENQYGDNMRDLLYMYNDENLSKIFNIGSTQAFKQGGQMNVIPEGALHARKNNMEGAGEDFTAKGIPVVDNNGEQQAEIEKNEVIFNKDLTDFIENNLKKFNSEETSNSEKDEIAIKVGKRLVKELLTNTDDRTGLIEEVQEKI